MTKDARFTSAKRLLTAIGELGGEVQAYDAMIIADIESRLDTGTAEQRTVLTPMLEQARRAHKARGGRFVKMAVTA